jgi:hypothetical protein
MTRQPPPRIIARYYNRFPKTKLFIRFAQPPPKIFSALKKRLEKQPLNPKPPRADLKGRPGLLSIFPCGGLTKGGKWRRPGTLRPGLAQTG